MKTNSQIRQDAREIMRGNWLAAALVVFVYTLLAVLFSVLQCCTDDPMVLATLSFASLLYSFIVLMPVAFAMSKIFLELARNGSKPQVGDLFSIFKSPLYGKAILLQLLVGIFTFLWSLLLLIPGIIKSISYAMALYVQIDNPNLTPMEAINKSQQMMRGHKMDLFLIMLGMMGWILLSFITFGIAIFWIIPYYDTVFAKFYLELKAEQQ